MVENDLDCFDYSDLRSNRDPSHLLKLWKIYRNYTVHEDNLTSQRMGRLLTVQGFLFAAFGACVTEWGKYFSEFAAWRPDAKTPLASKVYESAMPIIFGVFALSLSWFGVRSARLSRRAIKASQLARKKLIDDWVKIAVDRSKELGLPGIAGGGSVKAFEMGEKNLKELPRIFQNFWIAVGGIVLIALGAVCYFIWTRFR